MAGLLNIYVILVTKCCKTKFIAMIVKTLVIPKVGDKLELLFNELESEARGRFVEQKLMLSSNVTKFIIVTDTIWVTL